MGSKLMNSEQAVECKRIQRSTGDEPEDRVDNNGILTLYLVLFAILLLSAILDRWADMLNSES